MRKQDDRDAEDDRPLKKPQGKKGGFSRGMTIAIVVAGGVLGVVGCAGCAGLGYWLFTSYNASPIVGTWEAVGQEPTPQRITYGSFGRGSVHGAKGEVPFSYNLKGDRLERQFDENRFQKVGDGRVIPHAAARFRVRFNGNDEMFVQPDLANAPEQRFRRVK